MKNNINWNFDNTYSKLPEPFREKINPVKVKNPKLILLNESLAKDLNLDFSEISQSELSAIFTGNKLPKNSDSIASICIWKLRKSQHGSVGQVNISGDRVLSVRDKDESCNFPYVWGTVAWKKQLNKYIDAKDPHIGYAVQKATENGEKINYVLNDGYYFDCGTVEQYWKLINYISFGKEAD